MLNKIKTVITFLDIKATGYAFIDQSFVHSQQLKLYSLLNPKTLNIFKSEPVLTSPVT